MFLFDLLFALLSALLISAVFALVFNHRGPWDSFLLFFVVILLFTWAGGTWMTPFGPVLFGGYWLPFLLAALVVALLLAAATPVTEREVKMPDETGAPDREHMPGPASALASVGFFFWLLVVMLVVAIVISYME